MKRIICGPRAVAEALRSAPREINLLLLRHGQRAPDEIVQRAGRASIEVIPCPTERLDALAGDIKHQGIIAITGTFPYLDLEGLLARAQRAQGPALLLALDQVQDVQNLGSLIRSAVALDAHGLILCRHHAAGVSPTVVRVSTGATEHAAVARITNLSQTLVSLKKQDMTIVGLDAEGAVPIDELDLTGAVVLVLGSEGQGLRRLVRERCDHLASIPIPGPIESLNVAVTGALALYEARRQRKVSS
jgi:23S rRNA (guanosine2251-2'-O)-methyltransferase